MSVCRDQLEASYAILRDYFGNEESMFAQAEVFHQRYTSTFYREFIHGIALGGLAPKP